MKDQHPVKPWSLREFFTGFGYYTHNTEGYVPRLESLIIPSRPPPAERSAEDQPFLHVPNNPDDPRVGVDITSGSASLTASQLYKQDALSQKNAAAASNALSMAKYIHMGRPHGGFPNFGIIGHSGPPAPYQLYGTQGGRGCCTSLGPSASGPPADDRYRQFNSYCSF